MSPMIIDGEKVPTADEYVENLEADIKELRKRVDEERKITDYYFNKYMELKHEMQRVRNER